LFPRRHEPRRPKPTSSRRFPVAFCADREEAECPFPNAASSPASKSSPSSNAASPALRGAAKTLDPGSPADATKTGDQAKAGNQPAAPKKKAKAVTIDPALLERALQNRNGVR